MSKVQYLYPLYQTLDQNIPKTAISVQNKKLINKAVNDLSKSQKEALLSLIIEHHRLEYFNSGNEDMYDYQKAPYGGIFDENEVQYSFSNTNKDNNLPYKLQWIILKFINVCNSDSSNSENNEENIENNPK